MPLIGIRSHGRGIGMCIATPAATRRPAGFLCFIGETGRTRFSHRRARYYLDLPAQQETFAGTIGSGPATRCRNSDLAHGRAERGKQVGSQRTSRTSQTSEHQLQNRCPERFVRLPYFAGGFCRLASIEAAQRQHAEPARDPHGCFERLCARFEIQGPLGFGHGGLMPRAPVLLALSPVTQVSRNARSHAATGGSKRYQPSRCR